MKNGIYYSEPHDLIVLWHAPYFCDSYGEIFLLTFAQVSKKLKLVWIGEL